MQDHQVASPVTPRATARRRLPIRPSATPVHIDDVDIIPDPSSELWISPTAMSNNETPIHMKPPSPVIIGTPSTGNRLRTHFNTPERPSPRVNFVDRLKQVVDADDDYLKTHSFLPITNNHPTREAMVDHDNDSTPEPSFEDNEDQHHHQQQHKKHEDKEDQHDKSYKVIHRKDLRLLDVEVIVPIDSCSDGSSEKEPNEDNDEIPLLPPDHELSELIHDNIAEGSTPLSEIPVTNNRRESLAGLPSNKNGSKKSSSHQHIGLSSGYSDDPLFTSIKASDKWVVKKNPKSSIPATTDPLSTRSRAQSHTTPQHQRNASSRRRFPKQKTAIRISERVRKILKKRKGPMRPSKRPWKKRKRSSFRVQER